MTWIPLLLTEPSPCLRWLVLRELLHFPKDHPEVVELNNSRMTDPSIIDLLALQGKDGSWAPGSIITGKVGGNRILATGFALTRLGYLGFNREFPPVERGATYLFNQQLSDGSWPLSEEQGLTDGSSELPKSERYSMIPLQTAFPLRGLAACGYLFDTNIDKAFDWLLKQRLPDGAWPTGVAANVFGYVGGYRRLAHSRWGCRSNTTGALICLAFHPEKSHSPEAKKALDHLLSRETREVQNIGLEVARLIGAEPAHGFISYFGRFDLALLLDLCSRVGGSTSDQRISDIADFLLNLRNRQGIWEYPTRPHISRWVTFDLLRSISRIEINVDWIDSEPRTPFQPYPKRIRRY